VSGTSVTHATGAFVDHVPTGGALPGFEGVHANYELADFLVANGLLVPGDLARLGGTL